MLSAASLREAYLASLEGHSVFFHDRELICRCGCRLLRLHRGFRDALEALRRDFNRQMVLTSACRCKVHNDRPAKDGGAGGHPKSLHVGDFPQHEGQDGCLAVDVATPNGAYRGDLFVLAWKHGFSIGWGNGFMHLDLRTMIGLPQTTFSYS